MIYYTVFQIFVDFIDVMKKVRFIVGNIIKIMGFEGGNYRVFSYR